MNKTVTKETIKKYDTDGHLIEEHVIETTDEWYDTDSFGSTPLTDDGSNDETNTCKTQC